MADRYTYVPLLGIFIALLWLLPERRPLLYVSLPVLLVFSVLTSLQASRWQNSVSLYQHALSCTTRNALAHNNLGTALMEREEAEEAIRHFREAVKIRPEYLDARFNYGKTLELLGRSGEAAEQLRAGLKIKPDHVEAANNLAWLLATDSDPEVRNGREAVKWAEIGCRLTGRENPVLLDTLAAAYAEAGRFKDAEKAQSQAIDIAVKAGHDELVAEGMNRLMLYQERRPYRPNQ